MNPAEDKARENDFEKIKAHSKRKEKTLEEDNTKDAGEEESLYREAKQKTKEQDERYKEDIERRNLINRRFDENTKLRKQYARKVVCFMYAYFTMVMAIVFLQGFSYREFHITEVALTTLIGGAFVSAIGLVGFVVKGLFPNGADE